MAAELEIQLDQRSFSQFSRDVRAFDQVLYKRLRVRLREAGEVGVKAVRARLMSRPYKTDAGLAAGLAAGTRVSIRTGAKTAGVIIQTTGKKLPANKQSMVRAYNKTSFRHPVMGDRDVWVTQSGRPYFGAVLNKERLVFQTAVEAALADAAKSIRAGQVIHR